MNKRRLTCSLALVVIFITCVTGKNDVPPGCKVEDSGKKLDCSGVGLNRIPKTIPEGVTIADFRDNNIKHIGKEDAKSLNSRLDKVYLSGNPFHCDCNLNDLRRLLKKKKIPALQANGHNIECASPPHVKNKVLTSLLRRELCGSTAKNSQRPSFHKKKKDKDECKTTADCSKFGKKCHNTNGSYECKCDPGFWHSTERNKCMDEDECKSRKNNCSHHSYCKNTHGGFKCVCPKNYELSNFKCIPNDITRWITPKYLLQDIKDGVWSRILAIPAAFVILLSLCVLGVVGIRKMWRKCAERREMKRLAYEEQLMFAARLIDPDHLFLEGEMGYQGDKMFYPGDMGYPPEGMGYPPDGMGYPPGGVMGYADDMEYNDEMDYSEENFDNDKPNISPMTTNENFDQMVPHTYYEDDQYEDKFEREGKAY